MVSDPHSKISVGFETEQVRFLQSTHISPHITAKKRMLVLTDEFSTVIEFHNSHRGCNVQYSFTPCILASVYARVMFFLFARVHIQSVYHSEQTHIEPFAWITSEKILSKGVYGVLYGDARDPQPIQVYVMWCGCGGVCESQKLHSFYVCISLRIVRNNSQKCSIPLIFLHPYRFLNLENTPAPSLFFFPLDPVWGTGPPCRGG